MTLAKCAHFEQHRTAQALYDTVVARYYSPATAALGRLLLPYLFPELSVFATVEDLVSHLRANDARYRAAIPAEFLDRNPPPMYITLYFIVTRLLDSLCSVRDHFLSLDPTSLTDDLLEQHLLAAETSAVALGAARGTPRPPFFEGCSPSPLAPSYASAAAADVSVPEDVGAASPSAKRRSSKGKGGRGSGGGSSGGGGGSGGSGGGSSGGGGGGGTGGGSGGSGGGGRGSGGSGGGGGSGTSGGGTGAQRVGFGGGQREQQKRRNLLKSRIAIFDLDFDAFLSAMYALSVSAEGDCYWCVPPDPGIAVAALGASESGTLPGTAPAEALHTFMLDSGASRCFFRDSTTLTPLPTPVPVRLADPSKGPVIARSSIILPCPAVPSGSLSGLHLPSFSTNLVSTAALQDAMVTTTTPGGHRVSICTCIWTGHHLATFIRRLGSSLYTLATEPSQVAASAQLSVSGQVAASCSCRLLSNRTLLWHHCVGHPSLPRLRGMHSGLLVSGLPRSLPPLPPSPAPPCLPCVEGRQRATPHSSSFPPTTYGASAPSLPTGCVTTVSSQAKLSSAVLVLRRWTGLFVDSGAARGTTSGGAEPGGAESEGAETGGAGHGGVATGGAKHGGVATGGGEPGGAELEGVEPGFACRRVWSLEVQSLGVLLRLEVLPVLRRDCLRSSCVSGLFRRTRLRSGASGAGGARAAGARGTGVAVGAGVPGGPTTSGPGGARTRGTGAARTGDLEGAVARDLTESGTTSAGGAGAGGAGVSGLGAGGAGVGGPSVGGARAGGAGGVDPRGTVRPRPYFVPLLQQVLGTPPSAALTPPLLCPLPDQSQLPLQPASPLHAPSPYTEQSGGLTERRLPASCLVSPVHNARRVPHSRPPPVPSTHAMALRPSSVQLQVPLPPPPESSLPEVPDPESDRARAASPTVSHLLATAVTDPSFESAAAFAVDTELLDFAAACRLDYATALVAESTSASPPSVGGECALGTDVLEDRQEDFECLAAAVPCFASMLLALEGDPDAPDIPTPRSYTEAITGTYVDEVPLPGANIVDGMWIFRVKRPPRSPPAFKACYLARGFSQRQGVDYFQTSSPTLKMTTLWVLLHVAAQRDYKLHSLDFSTPSLQGSLHEEIWLHRPPGFTESFLAGTQWSLWRPVYGLRQVCRKWHNTLRTTLAALGCAPAIADPSLFLRTDTSLPPFYVLVYDDDLVFATADTNALTLVKLELQKRHTCNDLGELRSYLGLQITRDRARRTITLTQSHMVHRVLLRFGFQFSSPQPTPLSTSHSLSPPPSDESGEPSGPYPELVGCLIYLMKCTRPDLAYPLSLLAPYVASGMGLVLGGRGPVVLTRHTDASWVDDSATQRSSQGYTFSLAREPHRLALQPSASRPAALPSAHPTDLHVAPCCSPRIAPYCPARRALPPKPDLLETLSSQAIRIAGGAAGARGTRGAAGAGGARATSPRGATGAGGAGPTGPGGTASAGGAAGAGGAGAEGSGGAEAAGPGGARTGGARGTAGAGGAGAGGTGGTGRAGAAGPGGACTRGAGAARASGAAGAGSATEAAGTGGAGGTAGAGGAGAGGTGGIGGAGAAGPGGARTRGAGAAKAGSAASAGGVGGATGAAGAGGTSAASAGGAGATDQSLPQLLPGSSLPDPPPHTEVTEFLTKRCEPETRASTPVRARRVARPRPPAVLGTHGMALRPSSVPQHVVLPEPPASSLSHVTDPESDLARAASPTVTRLLATVVTDPDLESTTAFALVTELVDFAARSRLEYVASLVTESESVCPPSVGGEPALSSDVVEDRQFELECLAAALPRFASMLLCPEGDPDALDIPTPRSYAEAITGEYSSQWQTAMDAEMASWKSTGTYVDEVPPPGANIVDGMWIFRVKRPPGSPLAFKRDYELHSLDSSTAFLFGSLHEESWLRNPPSFTGTTLAALGFAPSSADPLLFLRTDTTLPPFYVLVYVEDLVFATDNTEALALVKAELQERHTCTDLGELRSYLGL
ncbi:unnamed protein product [Closterium sp. NIES-53]